MEIIVLIVILVAGVAVYYNTRTKPTKASEEAPYKVEAPSVLDVNKDGKVNIEDAIAAVDATVENAKAIKEKAVKAVKKTTAKKTPAKKTAKKQ